MSQTAYKPGSVPPSVKKARRSFLWTAPCGVVLATNPDSSDQRRSCPFDPIWGQRARHPYSVLLQAGLAMPSRSPGPRWALTPPFHPYPRNKFGGGLLSVALSLGSPPAVITRRLVAVEPGLSSPVLKRARSPGRLARPQGGGSSGKGQGRAGGYACAAARSTAISVARVSPSATPSQAAGRQWRWKAITLSRVSASNRPDGGLS